MKLLVQENGVSKSERRTINLIAGSNMTVTVTDDPTGNQVDVQFDSTGGAGGTPSGTVESETSFGIAASAGVASAYSRGDHTHGSPTNPVTAHEAAGDPHTGYRLESADHTHQSTGAQAGQLDHGLALTGLGDNDHTQYILHSIADAQGDLLLASGADAFARLPIGADATVLTSNGTTASWQVAGAASHPSFVTHLRFASHG